jgi:cytochrome P450
MAETRRLRWSSVFRPRSWVGVTRNTTRLVLVHVRWLAISLLWRARALARGSRVPPGALRPGDGIRGNQCRVLDAMPTLGPVLKIASDDLPTTYVVGLARGRRLLAEHEDDLRGLTVDLKSLFPRGAVRGMEGEEHRNYRRLLLQALQSVPLESQWANVDAAIGTTLESLVATSPVESVSGPAIRAALREGTSRIMMGVLYGIDPSHRTFAPMRDAFRRFGPREPIYELSEPASAAFQDLLGLARTLAEEIRNDPGSARPSMLHHAVDRDQLDETALGNLVNVFEASHYDTYSLWHWVLWYLVREPALRARIRSLPSGSAEATALLHAIVWETLRLNQSESLLRGTTRDITFDGYFIPRGHRIRVCLWESHKDPTIFPDPFRFDPDRFLGRTYGIEEFAPFGLDKKRCIGADMVVQLSARFVERMAREYDWEIIADGPPYRSVYHWQPSPVFAIRATPRSHRSQ